MENVEVILTTTQEGTLKLFRILTKKISTNSISETDYHHPVLNIHTCASIGRKLHMPFSGSQVWFPSHIGLYLESYDAEFRTYWYITQELRFHCDFNNISSMNCQCISVQSRRQRLALASCWLKYSLNFKIWTS